MWHSKVQPKAGRNCVQNRFGVGKKKAIADSEALSFFYPIIMKAVFLVLAEWSHRDRAAIGKEERSSPQRQGRAGLAWEEAIIRKIKIRK